MNLKNYNGRMMPYNFVGLILVSILAQQALAVTSIPCKTSKFSEFSNLVEKISVIGSEDRKTFEAYAAEKGLPLAAVEKKFAATGVLNCDGRSVTAQLTGSNSVITTAAHFFVERKSIGRCKEMAPSKCSFYTYKGGWTVEHPVEIGSLKMSGCNVDQDTTDWAVLRLNKPAKGIKPYALASHPATLKEGDKVINPVAFSMNFKPSGDFSRSVIECSIRENIWMTKTDCDAGPGASGSAQLVEENGTLVQVAIHTGPSENNQGSDYDSNSNFNRSTAIQGEFFEAVQEAIGKPARTASAKDKRDKGI